MSAKQTAVWATINSEPHHQLTALSPALKHTALQQHSGVKSPLKGSFVSSQINHLRLTERCCMVLIYNNRRHCSVTWWKGVQWDQPLRPFPIQGSALSSCAALLNGLAEWCEHMALVPVGLREQTKGKPQRGSSLVCIKAELRTASFALVSTFSDSHRLFFKVYF